MVGLGCRLFRGLPNAMELQATRNCGNGNGKGTTTTNAIQDDYLSKVSTVNSDDEGILARIGRLEWNV